ncbi:uncharacterized protein JN550_007932 [Neoarthrinium moseri]|uniref:uncharacterized protein n=1 Tax=Neoarthrinium moseri TaxID=1658444 RepID=UPI001FDC938F|nr:uncharacterized protein JN550_007932 [Neoarthrinium moseri]KAI1865954.1 hypothetical protein JN550_007932 [Neoarthrinium moseri]
MPQFTPLQLKLHIRDHHDLGFNLVSKYPVNVDRPPHIPLHDRIPRNNMATSSPSSSSASAAPIVPNLPPVSSLSTAPIKAQIQALDLLFEPSTELHGLALPALRPRRVSANPGISADLPPPPGAPHPSVPEPAFTSYAQLIKHIGTLLTQLARSADAPAKQKLHGILGSHPRLGAKKVDSAQSQAEQASLNAGAADEAEKLHQLNAEYEAKFPGLRYVVFVNGRSRPVIMENMRQRIDRGDIDEEELEAINAMVDIALDRAKKLQATD